MRGQWLNSSARKKTLSVLHLVHAPRKVPFPDRDLFCLPSEIDHIFSAYSLSIKEVGSLFVVRYQKHKYVHPLHIRSSDLAVGLSFCYRVSLCQSGKHYYQTEMVTVPELEKDCGPYFEQMNIEAVERGGGNHASLRLAQSKYAKHIKYVNFDKHTDHDIACGYVAGNHLDCSAKVAELKGVLIPPEISESVNTWSHTSDWPSPRRVANFRKGVDKIFSCDTKNPMKGPDDYRFTSCFQVLYSILTMPVERVDDDTLALITIAPENPSRVARVSKGDKAFGVAPILGNKAKKKNKCQHVAAKTCHVLEALLTTGEMADCCDFIASVAFKATTQEEDKRIRTFFVSDGVYTHLLDSMMGTLIKSTYCLGNKSLAGLSMDAGGVSHIPLMWSQLLSSGTDTTCDQAVENLSKCFGLEVDMSGYDLRVPPNALALISWKSFMTVGQVDTDGVPVSTGLRKLLEGAMASNVVHSYYIGKHVASKSGTVSGSNMTTLDNTEYNTVTSSCCEGVANHECLGDICYVCSRLSRKYNISEEMKKRATYNVHLGDDMLQLCTDSEDDSREYSALVKEIREKWYGMIVKEKVAPLFSVPDEFGMSRDGVSVLQHQFRLDYNVGNKPVVSAWREVSRPLGKALSNTNLITKMLINLKGVAIELGNNPAGHELVKRFYDALYAWFLSRGSVADLPMSQQYIAKDQAVDEGFFKGISQCGVFPDLERAIAFNTPCGKDSEMILRDYFIDKYANLSSKVLSLSSL